MVRAFSHGAMGRRVDPSWSVPIELFFRSSQCSTTGVTKARRIYYPVCEMVHIKKTLLLSCGGSGFPLFAIRVVLYHMSDAI